MFLIHATQAAESIRVPTNDERIAAWAARYFAQGHLRRPSKPRMRAASPSTTEPAHAGKDSSK